LTGWHSQGELADEANSCRRVVIFVAIEDSLLVLTLSATNSIHNLLATSDAGELSSSQSIMYADLMKAVVSTL